MGYAQKQSMIIRMNYHRIFLSMTTYHFLFRLPKPPTYYMTINGVASPSAKGALSAPRTWSKIYTRNTLEHSPPALGMVKNKGENQCGGRRKVAAKNSCAAALP